jgi:hypothetical protein
MMVVNHTLKSSTWIGAIVFCGASATSADCVVAPAGRDGSSSSADSEFTGSGLVSS